MKRPITVYEPLDDDGKGVRLVSTVLGKSTAIDIVPGEPFVEIGQDGKQRTGTSEFSMEDKMLTTSMSLEKGVLTTRVSIKNENELTSVTECAPHERDRGRKKSAFFETTLIRMKT